MEATSPLQNRIKEYQSIINKYNDNDNGNIELLFQFVMILCKEKNYDGAEDILSHLIKSQCFPQYKQIASIWILRSEIAEEIGEYQKAVKLFEKAAKCQAKVIMHHISD